MGIDCILLIANLSINVGYFLIKLGKVLVRLGKAMLSEDGKAKNKEKKIQKLAAKHSKLINMK